MDPGHRMQMPSSKIQYYFSSIDHVKAWTRKKLSVIRT
jgi:hypothetical protein